MKTKAELLQGALKNLRRQLAAGGTELPSGVGTMIGLDESIALVEALESLRWVNLRVRPADYIKHGHTHFTSLGIFYKDAEQALRIGKEAGLETIGVIELKDNE